MKSTNHDRRIHFHRLRLCATLLLLASSHLPLLAQLSSTDSTLLHAAETPVKPERWEKTIQDFERQDQATPPQPGAILFCGSSSIVRWNLAESFPEQRIVARGFGGSHLSDVLHYARRIILPHRPQVLVVYAGDNDLASGVSPAHVAQNFRDLTRLIHQELPATKIICIGIKASLERWPLADKIRAANQLLEQHCSFDSRLAFVDVFTPMLDSDGRPQATLLADDRLHLSAAGYQLWTKLLTPVLVAAQDQTADYILTDLKIATVNARDQIVDSIALRGDRILAVGTWEDLREHQGAQTKIVTLPHRFLMPGLIDSHVHAGDAGMHEFDHPIPDMETIAQVLDYVKSRVRAVPPGQWIWVHQIFITRLQEQRFPTRAELDAIAPDHPIVFSTGPDAMVNSLALQLSGIDKDFKVTGSGSIEKDAQGELTGMLRGGTKRFLKGDSPPSKATEADRDARLRELLADYNSVGITTIADRNAGSSQIARYERLLQKQQLTTRVALSHAVNGQDRVEAVEEAIRKIAQHPLRAENPWLRIVGIKTFLDGGMLTGSAYMREPWGVSSIYGITDPTYRGVLFIPPERLLPIVRTTVESGLQFTAHAVGDGAIHTLLDAYAQVNEKTAIRATRPCLTHSNFLTADAVRQMAALGVVADIQPAWLYLDSRTLTAQFGYDRLRYFQPLQTMFQQGAIAGGGSDHMQKIGSLRSINPYDPFLGIWTTVTRRGKWYDGKLHPEEALSRAQALRFYTANNAYLTFLDHQLGSLEPGKLADFIVLDKDLLECPVDEIRQTKVIATFLGGKQLSPAKPQLLQKNAPGE
ncbi:MAG: amidohydrolase family protein [Planctomycetota bacterium]